MYELSGVILTQLEVISYSLYYILYFVAFLQKLTAEMLEEHYALGHSESFYTCPQLK